MSAASVQILREPNMPKPWTPVGVDEDKIELQPAVGLWMSVGLKGDSDHYWRLEFEKAHVPGPAPLLSKVSVYSDSLHFQIKEDGSDMEAVRRYIDKRIAVANAARQKMQAEMEEQARTADSRGKAEKERLSGMLDRFKKGT
jgi:hypothetical protein